MNASLRCEEFQHAKFEHLISFGYTALHTDRFTMNTALLFPHKCTTIRKSFYMADIN